MNALRAIWKWLWNGSRYNQNMEFEEQAKSRGLKEKTIAILLEEDYDTVDAIMTMTTGIVQQLKISLGQQGLLRKWIDELKSEQKSDGKTSKLETTCTKDEALLGLGENSEKDVDEYIKKYGVDEIGKFMREKLNTYKDVPVNVATTGQSGAGKSSFINCVRNMLGEDGGAAKVGCQETTMEKKAYGDPDNPNIVYWDLPGIGTSKFPREKYLELVEFSKYDFFLIMSSERFKEDDLYLAKSVHKSGKKFFFVRTKIDSDIDNDKYSKPSRHDPEELIKRVRDNSETHLRDNDLFYDNVFIVSNRLEHKSQFDFPVLMETMVQNVPDTKRSSLILALTACSDDGIQAKKAELEKRIPTIALIAYDKESIAQSRRDCIIKEVEFYQKQFGLDKKEVEKMGVDQKTLGQRTLDLFGVHGEELLNVLRGLIGILNIPLVPLEWVSGYKDRKVIAIEEYLGNALNKCVEAAREILRRRMDIG